LEALQFRHASFPDLFSQIFYPVRSFRIFKIACLCSSSPAGYCINGIARFLIEAFTRNSKGDGIEGSETPLIPYVVRNGMKLPLLSIIFMILTLGVFFPEFLENLLNEIVYELGYL